MNLRCFLTLSNVNKPSYLIKCRPVTLAQVVELGQWTLQSDDFLNKFRSNCYRTGTGCFLKSVFTAFAPRFALIQISCNQNLKRKKNDFRYESAKNSPAPSFQRALSKSARIFTGKIKWKLK